MPKYSDAIERINGIVSGIASAAEASEASCESLRWVATEHERKINEANAKIETLAPSIERLTAMLARAEAKAESLEGSNLMLRNQIGECLEREANQAAGTEVKGDETPLLRAAQASHVALIGSAADKRAYLRVRGWRLGQLGWTSEHQPDSMPEEIALKQQVIRDVKPFAFLAIKEQ